MKKIFITGASSGIGRATATLLVQAGHEVWGTSRNLVRLPQMPRFHPVELDLSQPESVARAFAQALAEAGHLDVLINNAGSGDFGAAENISADALRDQFQILFFAQVELMRLALRAMRGRGQGLIINVSSLASRLPVPFMSAYNSAKAALAAFTMSIQLELEGSDIHIVDLQPGDIRTSFNDAIRKNETDSRYEQSLTKAWQAVDRNMKHAPNADLVARQVVKLIGQISPPSRLTVGSTFQAKIAPLIFRFLPQHVRIWGLKKYYGI